jgi:RNA-directed DNA polymerase
MGQAKPFAISKLLIWRAYKRVKANKGVAGVDSESMEEFERKLEDNLYKIWNRMASGSYFPPPVRTVAIPKADGGERKLGIPTVADRIAQTVVAMSLEPIVEPHFHPDSYGYRRRKSAVQAVAMARERCWHYDWVIDLDIRGFFDNLDHALMMRAVRKYTDCPWMLLYCERWLKAPAQNADGTLTERAKGTPQGGVISPLLANIFLHLSLDQWMRRTYPQVPFERYADDVIVHCKSEQQAQEVKRSIEARLRLCKLELHPEKTKIVYCKDDHRRRRYRHEKFDFLGYTFRARQVRDRRGQLFVSFSPAVSLRAATKMQRSMKRWRLHLRSDQAIGDLARICDPVVRGWINYYGRFQPSALRPVFRHLNATLKRWAMRKCKRLRRRPSRATAWLAGIARREPKLFAHWELLGLKPLAG